MSQKLILHVGTHKTGTTAIQNTLARNRADLPQAGVAFPLFKTHFKRTKASRNAHFANVAVSRACGVEQLVAPDSSAFTRVKACERAIAPYVESSDDVILSDEWLWRDASMCSGYWEKLRAYFENLGFHKFLIVVYVRRQDKLAEALWNQRVKTPVGYTCTLKEYLEDERTRAICDYYAGIERLASTFGKDNLVVRRFERDCFTGGDVVPDFLDAIGVNPQVISHAIERDPNSRLSNDAVELKRRLNANEAIACTDYSTFDIANTITKMAMQVSTEHPESLKTNILAQNERESFLAQFAEGNRAIAREYFEADVGELFSAERSDAYALWEPGGASMLETYERMLELVTERYVGTAAELKSLKKRSAKLERQLEELESSHSYRIGQAITSLPRGIKQRKHKPRGSSR